MLFRSTSSQSNPVPHGQNLPPKEGKVGQSPGPDEEELGMAAPPKVGKTAEKSPEDVGTTGEKPLQEASRNERAANDRNRKPFDQPPDEDIGFSAPPEGPEVGQPKMRRSQEDIFPPMSAPPLPMPRMSRPPSLRHSLRKGAAGRGLFLRRRVLLSRNPFTTPYFLLWPRDLHCLSTTTSEPLSLSILAPDTLKAFSLQKSNK